MPSAYVKIPDRKVEKTKSEWPLTEGKGPSGLLRSPSMGQRPWGILFSKS